MPKGILCVWNGPFQVIKENYRFLSWLALTLLTHCNLCHIIDVVYNFTFSTSIIITRSVLITPRLRGTLTDWGQLVQLVFVKYFITLYTSVVSFDFSKTYPKAPFWAQPHPVSEDRDWHREKRQRGKKLHFCPSASLIFFLFSLSLQLSSLVAQTMLHSMNVCIYKTFHIK